MFKDARQYRARKSDNMTDSETKKAIWDDFITNSPKSVAYTRRLLGQGENVVVVMGDHVSMCSPHKDTTTPFEAAMTLQEKLVSLTGLPLPIGNDGLPVFALLAWKSTDPFDAPHEVCLVAMAGRPTKAVESALDILEQLGMATLVKPKNHLFEL